MPAGGPLRRPDQVEDNRERIEQGVMEAVLKAALDARFRSRLMATSGPMTRELSWRAGGSTKTHPPGPDRGQGTGRSATTAVRRGATEALGRCNAKRPRGRERSLLGRSTG